MFFYNSRNSTYKFYKKNPEILFQYDASRQTKFFF